MAARLERRRVIRRRSDGMVEIRRARARDLVLTSDAAVLLGMLAGWLCFVVILMIALMFDPPLLAVAGWVVLLMFVEDRARRQPRLAAAHLSPPPGNAA